jgi:Holliday junction resolvase RusA-like endonuclease
MGTLIIEVIGIPQTAGSKRSFVIPRAGQPLAVTGPNGRQRFNGRVIITDDNPNSRDWKNRVAQEGQVAMRGQSFERPLFEGPLAVTFVFRMPRIKGHYRASGELKPNAPMRPTVRPDALKLARAAEDALTGVVWRDDSQIVIEHLEKVYDEKPGCTITVTPLGEPIPKPKPAREMELKL